MNAENPTTEIVSKVTQETINAVIGVLNDSTDKVCKEISKYTDDTDVLEKMSSEIRLGVLISSLSSAIDLHRSQMPAKYRTSYTKHMQAVLKTMIEMRIKSGVTSINFNLKEADSEVVFKPIVSNKND